MRLQELSAATIVNKYKRNLYIVFKEGGVGSEAKQIARAIVRARPIERTNQLAEVIAAALHGRYREKQGHPATVVFAGATYEGQR